MNRFIQTMQALFADTRCIIAFVLTLNYCLAVWFVPTERLEVLSDIIKMVLCFYFGIRSSMTTERKT